jgi:hypothetical protein
MCREAEDEREMFLVRSRVKLELIELGLEISDTQ